MKTNTLDTSKNNAFIVLFFFVVLLIFIPLVLFLFTKNTSKKELQAHISQTAVPSVQPSYLPSPSQIQPSITQNPQQQLLNKVSQRPSLSSTDAVIKNKILSSIPLSEIVFQTPDVTVEYIQSFDLFQGEINTPNVNAAKIEVITWFINQGMTQQGVCNLPLSFYLNFTVKSQLPDDGNSFNPLPLGC